ncbi:hypothetical protein GYMLUDRAFT_96327 [Collybiopsis luxurians FD-317 M1]|uniref:Concanavalin A-like lectin/glucanase n=1 Tax=Collybiopsis luxurians FD-317 M1 TaxID=944289 RepID=A0A0D0CZG1_9AGAR|nr:hypothetical protein GYMLUDRAFT_96327 [Collybiopsis luxurians FD-317 M1]
MKVSAIFLASAALASSSVWAIPRELSRRTGHHSSPLSRSAGPQTETTEAANNATIQFSGNWSGAVLTSPPAGETFTTASGTFTVPTMVTGNGDGAAAAWVGIDGDTFPTAILQAGVFFEVSGDTVTYGAFYEWWPNFATDIPTELFSMEAGDVITVEIVATSDSQGTITLINQTKKTQFSTPQSAPTKLNLLGGQNAEWIVEDFTQNGGLVPLANWGTLTFTNASASTSSRTKVDLSTATIFDIEQFGSIFTDVTIDSTSRVSVAFA